jgi:hypothetical protein
MNVMHDNEVIKAAEQLSGLYEVLCSHLHDEEKRRSIWSAICRHTEQIGTAFVARPAYPSR